MSPSKGLTIFDARSKLAANANRMRGGGFEDESHYNNLSLNFCGIMNIHTVRNNYNKMKGLVYDNVFDQINEYGPAIEETSYY